MVTDERRSQRAAAGAIVRAGALGRTTVASKLPAALVVVFGLLLGSVQTAGATVAAPTPVSTSAPALAGTPVAGQTLTCSVGSWSGNPTTISYVWLRDGVAIAGQTANTYVVQSADQGHSISCRVTAGNGGGEYTITGLASASYKVSFYSFEVGNYMPQYYSGQATAAGATPVAVTAPNTTGGIGAAMHAGGEITGKVTDAVTHAALAGISVCASGTEVFVGCASTNAAGEYTIVGLPTGSYQVSFSGFTCNENGCSQTYLPQSKTAVAVTAPNTTPGIDAEMQAGGRISGKVTDASTHATLAGIDVCAIEAGGNESFGGCALTNAGGEYTITGLASASYTVSFSGFGCGEISCTQQNYLHQYYNEQPSPTTATPVPVTAPNTTPNIDAKMQSGGQISGRVTDASGTTPLANIEACAFEFAGSEIVGSCSSTNANGEYTIKALPTGSKYMVSFWSFGQDYLPRYYNEQSSSASATAVPVTAGATVSGINARMQPGGHIAGTVTDASTHAPIAGISVCAFETGGGIGRCASTNAGGEYAIVGLPSGSYKVSFSGFTCNESGCSQTYLRQYYNEQPSSAAATPVSVTAPNTTPNIDAKMQSGGQISGRVTDALTHAPLANIEVCASSVGGGEFFGGCATTNGAGGSTSATSNALAVPVPGFTLAKVKFDPKTDDLDFFFDFPTPGTLQWGLFFRNADVGFADSLGISFGERGVSAEAAKKKKRKSKKCKPGFVKHKDRCVHVLVSFGAGSTSVPAGAVEVKVHASAKAIKALNQGHTLHVSGQFTFQPALGGAPIVHAESAVVHGHKKKRHKARGKHKHH